MTDGLSTEPAAKAPGHDDGALPQEPVRASSAWRVLVVLGLAAASAGLAFAIIRSTVRKPPADPTTERIQSLIDEANRLLKQLDEQKRD